jgi:pimeloyl-ACP methyl ester carboxylesterase
MKWLLLLLLTAPCWANTLSLEFAQEGEPTIPRAVIVIHNVFEDRSSFQSFFKAWADRSWARDQYCSVYSYEYEGNGLNDLVLPSVLAKDLYGRIRSDDFDSGRVDPVNPHRRTEPVDDRQPKPTLRGDNLELHFAGHGYGGLVARETALLAKKDGLKVTRVAYVGTPLDGLPTTELILAFSVLERASSLGLSQPLSAGEFSRLSDSWWHLTELYSEATEWSSYFAPVVQDVTFVNAYGTSPRVSHPTDNVLYGRHRRVAADDLERDGFLLQSLAWGKATGPVAWLKETVLKGTSQYALTESSGAFLIKELLQTELAHGYLVRRQLIEETVRGEGDDLPPLGVYWDERGSGMWRNAYASPKGLYEMMWEVAP